MAAVIRRHKLLAAVLCLVTWFGAVVVWASRPVSEHTPVEVIDAAALPPDQPVVSTFEVDCASILSSDTFEDPGSPPVLSPGYVFERPPCESALDTGMTALVLDGILFVAAAGVLVAVWARRRSEIESVAQSV